MIQTVYRDTLISVQVMVNLYSSRGVIHISALTILPRDYTVTGGGHLNFLNELLPAEVRRVSQELWVRDDQLAPSL